MDARPKFMQMNNEMKDICLAFPKIKRNECVNMSIDDINYVMTLPEGHRVMYISMQELARENYKKSSKEDIEAALTLPRIHWENFFRANAEQRKEFMKSDSAFTDH